MRRFILCTISAVHADRTTLASSLRPMRPDSSPKELMVALGSALDDYVLLRLNSRRRDFQGSIGCFGLEHQASNLQLDGN